MVDDDKLFLEKNVLRACIRVGVIKGSQTWLNIAGFQHKHFIIRSIQ
jgi:hypothetical protein